MSDVSDVRVSVGVCWGASWLALEAGIIGKCGSIDMARRVGVSY